MQLVLHNGPRVRSDRGFSHSLHFQSPLNPMDVIVSAFGCFVCHLTLSSKPEYTLKWLSCKWAVREAQSASARSRRGLSRRDDAIVAWHEVPGKSSSKRASRRVRSDRAGERTDSSDRRIGVTNFRNTKLKKFVLCCFHLAFLKKHGTHFGEKYLWD
jgi:hypothetical protein